MLDCCQFSDIHISQGSVATCLRHCTDGRIFKHGFVSYLLLSLSVKKCENRLIFGEVIGNSLVSCFLTHSVDLRTVGLCFCSFVLRAQRYTGAVNLYATASYPSYTSRIYRNGRINSLFLAKSTSTIYEMLF